VHFGASQDSSIQYTASSHPSHPVNFGMPYIFALGESNLFALSAEKLMCFIIILCFFVECYWWCLLRFS